MFFGGEVVILFFKFNHFDHFIIERINSLSYLVLNYPVLVYLLIFLTKGAINVVNSRNSFMIFYIAFKVFLLETKYSCIIFKGFILYI